MQLRSPLARVRGLGAARAGTDEFITQRLTAIALIPLLLWFVVSIIHLARADYAMVIEWIKTPWVTVALILLILVLFNHAHSGLREVLQDYVHQEIIKTIAMVAMKFFIITITVSSVLAVLRIALGG
jgi:succinate dehydrogenase / fumarate reductase membrane anchor subunit